MRLKIQQWMMRYLRKRNWVVFFLEPEYRGCNATCWMKLYEAEMKRESSQ